MQFKEDKLAIAMALDAMTATATSPITAAA
jgi:hypothetical protein